MSERDRAGLWGLTTSVTVSGSHGLMLRLDALNSMVWSQTGPGTRDARQREATEQHAGTHERGPKPLVTFASNG